MKVEDILNLNNSINEIIKNQIDHKLYEKNLTFITNLLDMLAYRLLDDNNQIIKTNLPIGSIVYVCLMTEDFKEFSLEQKAFIPSSMYFDAINTGYGKVVFSDIRDAIRCINQKVGLDKCISENFPTIDENSTIYDNGSQILKEFSVYDRRLDDEFFKGVIHTDVN